MQAIFIYQSFDYYKAIMITNPNATRILCFGDSNTWGQRPDRKGRFAADERWTGMLQQQLGDSFEVIEEGLNSRTTDLEYTKKPGRNGKTYFVPCLQSHYPLDVVVVMLGTNDLKLEYGPRPAAEVAQAIAGLVADVREFGVFQDKTPHVIVVSPIHITVSAPDFTKLYTGYYDAVSAATATELATSIRATATQAGATFVDAAEYAGPGQDGIHMDQAGHAALGQALAHTIKGITS